MRVVLVSDTHLTPRTAAFVDNWSVVASWIEATPPDLVVHLGDITADGASGLEELDAARTVFARLTVPMRFIPGNHDIGDNPLETGASGEHALDLARLADYRRLFDVDRWAIDVGDRRGADA
jgi:3',5'-cyclic AMP phosphodiesterase CpdA